MDRAADLRADFDLLGRRLLEAEDKAVAAIARERRLIGAELDRLEAGEVSFVDELAAKRAGSGASRRASRRKSG